MTSIHSTTEPEKSKGGESGGRGGPLIISSDKFARSL